MATEVRPLQPVKLPAAPSALTPEQKYWKTFSSQLQFPSPHSSPVTHISAPPFVPSATQLNSPETFAVTSGGRVQVFSSRTRKVVKTITRFGVEDRAHSGDIRRDGRVLLAGGDSGAIQAFDINSRAILKTWKEHKQPVHVTKWSPAELTTLMSASDDTTVRLWDLPSDKSTQTFVGHQDYVRCGGFMPGQADRLLFSGSYDETVRLWDPRIRGKAVMTFKHAAAVESVLPLPSGTTLLAAAENTISVLDLVAGRPLQLLRNHQKTVTSLALANNGERVLSGGLDGHVKVFETTGWNVVAGFKYSSPVLSLAVIASGTEREDKHLAVGMENGLLSLKTRLSGQQKVIARERAKEMKALMEGKIEEYDKKKKKGKGWEKRLRGRDFTGEGADIIIDGNDRGKIKNMSKWETALRKGHYEKALDLVLEAQPYSKQDALTLLTALRHRSALRTALNGRDEITLQPVLKWLNRTIGDPRHVGLTTDVAFTLLDLYSEEMGQSAEIDAMVDQLHEKVRRNAEISQQAWSTQGMIDMLMAGTSQA
ncbi:putative small nucleolar ribonucleoprotein complex subunit protein [Botryosphaeria dothidea]|uniref:Small nucleolar ribonucleoprotein complex subunit protein n=1 Tax=Botryosphaeria dothidea TaxID=55169 RepID=A0A8H4ITS7_9PEZI|nr:putative small nucleolar ribonucleoprotein complex subunit protein [Botryosphaeria dothidea]